MVAAARVGDIRTPWDDHPGVAWSEDAGPACVRLVVRLANHPSSAAAGPRAAGGVPSPAPMDGAQDAPFLPADGCDGGHCFVVMPFGDRTLDTVYRTCVKRVLSDVCGIECTRGDDLFGSGGVVDTLVAKIAGARLVVADLTRRNPNVFYEVGIAHALRRPVLLLAQSMDDVPFDLKHRHVVIYEPTRAGRTRLRQTLGPRVEQFLLPSGPGADSMGVLS